MYVVNRSIMLYKNLIIYTRDETEVKNNLFLKTQSLPVSDFHKNHNTIDKYQYI